MYPRIYVLDSYISSYSFCAMAGITVSILLLNHLLSERLILRKYIGAYLISLVGMLVGAKALGFISKLIYNYSTSGLWKLEESFMASGIVYCGGLIGYICALRLICIFKERDWNEISNITAVAIPLFHTFGRIGCYFAGCCYGKESDSIIAIPYRIVLKDGSCVNRIPVQLMEAIFEFSLFLVFLYLYKYKLKKGKEDDNKMLSYYLILYSIWRFIIEFWRGDEVRGVFGRISFSQTVCIGIIIVVLLYKLNECRRTNS